MKNLLLLLAFALVGNLAISQTCVGKWTTIDDATGKKKSTVELYKYKEQLYGKVTYLYPREGRAENPVCDKCTDDRKGQPLVGLQIVRNGKWNGTEWAGGTIVDPENGKTYNTKLWLDPNDSNKLMVRGYIGPFFRTQTWVRTDD